MVNFVDNVIHIAILYRLYNYPSVAPIIYKFDTRLPDAKSQFKITLTYYLHTEPNCPLFVRNIPISQSKCMNKGWMKDEEQINTIVELIKQNRL